MKTKPSSGIKTLAYFLAIVALLSGVFTYMNTISMGFPDGHLTEFERAVKPLFVGYSFVALLFGILFSGIAWFSAKKYSRLVFYFGLGLFVIVVAALLILFFGFNANLNHGTGG